MKLFELVGVKSHYDKNANELIDLLKQGKKFKSLGRGHFAVALLHESGNVYKFWVKDSGYEDYVNYCLKNQDDPHLPKFKSPIKTISSFFKRTENFPDTIKYIKLEKLSKYYDDQHKVDEFNYYWICKRLIKFANSDYKFELEGENKEAGVWPTLVSQYGFSEDSKSTIEGLYKTISNIVKEVGRIDDLHDENMMMRGNTLVITDPIANRDDIRLMSDLWFAMEDPENLTVSGRTKTRTKT